MIILDTQFHKVDFSFVKSTGKDDGEAEWSQLTIFHQRTPSEWNTKVVRIPPETAIVMAHKILDYYKNGNKDATINKE